MGTDTKKAMAIVYNGKTHDAPQVVAAGRGEVAEKIIAAARSNGIYIKEDPDLVEILSKVPVGQRIPEDVYRAVAEILVFVYRMNKRLAEITNQNYCEEKKEFPEVS